MKSTAVPGQRNLRRRNEQQTHHRHPASDADSLRAQTFLAAACLWPLLVLLFFIYSSPQLEQSSNELVPSAASVGKNLRFNFRNVVDRVDIMGYGPTHPRVSAVIVGDHKENLVSSVESLFRYTDMNRIFVVTIVVDGHEEDKDLVRQLKKIDEGSIPHWHGLRPDIHETAKGDKEAEEDDPHGHKVHVMFNPQKRGVAESRADAVDFIRILQKHHEDTGLKSPEEDLILLLMQGGSQLTARSWLEPVTGALIVPPPIIAQHEDSSTVALKVANAVSFNLEGHGKRTGFDISLAPVVSDASAADINLSSGVSYPGPALNGAAVAMRLDTYLNLPSQDLSLTDAWAANLDLSLNLWLCADGIDMLRDVDVTSMERNMHALAAPLSPELVARFAAAWMDEVTAKKFFNAYSKVNTDITYLEWETFMAKARESTTFTTDLATRCRSFAWYAEEINTDISSFLSESADIAKEKQLNNAKGDKLLAEERKAEEVPSAKNVEVGKIKVVPHEKPEEGADKTDDFAIPERNDKRKPTKPLCDECLKIVQQAKPIDITYVNVSDGHKEHPHKGATDEKGGFGYIHDETALHLNPPPFEFEGDELKKACLKRDNNYRMLTERVFVDMQSHEEAIKSGKNRAKIFCLVYTIDAGHPRIPNIRQTWG